MLITKLKSIDELLPLIGERVVVICCEGCSEAYYPADDVDALLESISVSRTVITVITMANACNAGVIEQYQGLYDDDFRTADTVLVVSCGVGVQTIAQEFRANRPGRDNMVSRTDTYALVISACDTYPLPGYQGLTPSKYACALCGQCHLNDTAGICPITSCSKSLLNGQCGGAKKGMCEVEPDMECGWERINKRLNRLH